jgi:hypothetical protein
LDDDRLVSIWIEPLPNGFYRIKDCESQGVKIQSCKYGSYILNPILKKIEN